MQKRQLELLTAQAWLESYYLVGGTALALQLGHRVSIDFDFFTPNAFRQDLLIAELSKLWKFELFEEARDTLHGAIDGVKVSFLRYDYPLLKPARTIRHLRVAHLFDIALMKLSAISGRGIKKDFVDMFFLLQHFSLSDLLTAFSVKYGEGLGQRYHVLKSLVYFQDAEEDPMPRMIQLVSWEEVKHFMIQQVREVRR